MSRPIPGAPAWRVSVQEVFVNRGRGTRCAFSVAWALLLILSGCGGGSQSGASTASTVPVASTAPTAGFSLTCTLLSFSGNRCGSGFCSLTSTGIGGDARLSCAGTPPGVQCGFGPNPVTLPVNYGADTGFTVSVDPAVLKGPVQVRVVASAGGQQRTVDVAVASPAVPPSAAGDSMTIYGCAGYTEGLPSAASLRGFSSTYVGAWRTPNLPPNGFCSQVLAGWDAWFELVVPSSCVPEGGDVHLTSGGRPGCVSVPFHRGSTVFAEVVGRAPGQACP